MACPCALHLVGDDEATLRRAAEGGMGEVRRIEARYSRYRPDSIVSAINHRAGQGEAVAVDAETAALIDFAASLHRASGGAFDITAGVLRRAWDFSSGRLPTPVQVDALLPLVGWPQVAWDGQHIALPRPGMEIDFGGFGKEYAADRCAGVLAAAGVQGGFVDLGGDIRVIGPNAEGAPWQLGIRHPRDSAATVGGVALGHGALAPWWSMNRS
jgi:thiamine biosynthesis lipoprotein